MGRNMEAVTSSTGVTFESSVAYKHWRSGKPGLEMLDPCNISLPLSSTESLQEQRHTTPGRTSTTKRKPTIDQSWEAVLKAVGRYDDDMVKNWRDDIDTLLVFAGLFSAVVTAFAVESYKWLSEDANDTTVALLTQISLQLNGSQSIFPERPAFAADPSSIRINCFWFLSLIFSLTSALFGLLCKQWIREHQRDTQTRTPGEALALRQLRRESFDKWGVSSFLSVLPILLEVALLLFFVGVLDLLWSRNRIPFALCFIAVMLSAGLYLATTLLPTLSLPGNQRIHLYEADFDQLRYQFVCPYKSPQALAVYHLFCKFLQLALQIRCIPLDRFFRHRPWYYHIRRPATDWSSFDLAVVRQFDDAIPMFVGMDRAIDLKVYELRAFEWGITMFQDSPSMIPHLQNVIGTILPSVAISAVFGEWKHAIWSDTSASDVNLRLRDPSGFRGSKWQSPEGLERYSDLAPSPRIRNPILHYPEGIRMLLYHQYWMTMVRTSPTLEMALAQTFLPAIGAQHASLQQSAGLRFVIPFSVVDSLWTHEDAFVRRRSLQLLPFFEDAWRSCPGYPEVQHDRERLAFILALTKHLKRTDRTSALLTSIRGQNFIRFVHNEIISRRLYQPPPWGDVLRHLLMLEWVTATRRTQGVGNLPADYFAPMPDPSELLADIRYSVEIEYPHNPSHEENENRTLGPAMSNDNGQGEERTEQGEQSNAGGVGADECV